MRKFIRHPYTGVGFAVIGLLSAIIMGNKIAMLGWVAALFSALRVAENAP